MYLIKKMFSLGSIFRTKCKMLVEIVWSVNLEKLPKMRNVCLHVSVRGGGEVKF